MPTTFQAKRARPFTGVKESMHVDEIHIWKKTNTTTMTETKTDVNTNTGTIVCTGVKEALFVGER